MSQDPIVAEVRKVREEYARQFNFDLHAMHRDLKEQEKAGGRTIISFVSRSGIRTDSDGPTEEPDCRQLQDIDAEDTIPGTLDSEQTTTEALPNH